MYSAGSPYVRIASILPFSRLCDCTVIARRLSKKRTHGSEWSAMKPEQDAILSGHTGAGKEFILAEATERAQHPSKLVSELVSQIRSPILVVPASTKGFSLGAPAAVASRVTCCAIRKFRCCSVIDAIEVDRRKLVRTAVGLLKIGLRRIQLRWLIRFRLIRQTRRFRRRLRIDPVGFLWRCGGHDAVLCVGWNGDVFATYQVIASGQILVMDQDEPSHT